MDWSCASASSSRSRRGLIVTTRKSGRSSSLMGFPFTRFHRRAAQGRPSQPAGRGIFSQEEEEDCRHGQDRDVGRGGGRRLPGAVAVRGGAAVHGPAGRCAGERGGRRGGGRGGGGGSWGGGGRPPPGFYSSFPPRGRGGDPP